MTACVLHIGSAFDHRGGMLAPPPYKGILCTLNADLEQLRDHGPIPTCSPAIQPVDARRSRTGCRSVEPVAEPHRCRAAGVERGDAERGVGQRPARHGRAYDGWRTHLDA